jgi:hypothetical protein
MGRLERKLDVGLINKINGGWKPAGKSLARKSGGQMAPRASDTYRAARRNKLHRR